MVTPLPVAFELVFPAGAYVTGDVEPVRDFDAKGSSPVQKRDKGTGLPMWQVSVHDSDPTAKGAAKAVKVVVLDERQPVPLTVDQVRDLVAALPERNRAMVVTQAGLGLRIGELLALRTEDVDQAAGVVRVEYQIAPGQRSRTEPKTPTSRRTIPLPGVVADALREHMVAFPPLPDGTLFGTRFGQPYSHAHYGAQIFKRAVERAGLPARVTPHDLRHHYASVLLAAGESVIAVAERLGHENASLVLSTYGHLVANSEDRTRRAIDAAWASAPDVPPDAEGTP
jgi:integrase